MTAARAWLARVTFVLCLGSESGAAVWETDVYTIWHGRQDWQYASELGDKLLGRDMSLFVDAKTARDLGVVFEGSLFGEVVIGGGNVAFADFASNIESVFKAKPEFSTSLRGLALDAMSFVATDVTRSATVDEIAYLRRLAVGKLTFEQFSAMLYGRAPDIRGIQYIQSPSTEAAREAVEGVFNTALAQAGYPGLLHGLDAIVTLPFNGLEQVLLILPTCAYLHKVNAAAREAVCYLDFSVVSPDGSRPSPALAGPNVFTR